MKIYVLKLIANLLLIMLFPLFSVCAEIYFIIEYIKILTSPEVIVIDEGFILFSFGVISMALISTALMYAAIVLVKLMVVDKFNSYPNSSQRTS